MPGSSTVPTSRRALAEYLHAYRIACVYLQGNGTTVAGRRIAIEVRDQFEKELRAGVYDSVLFEVLKHGV